MNVFSLLARGATRPPRWHRTQRKSILGVLLTGTLVAMGSIAVSPAPASAATTGTWTQLSPDPHPSGRTTAAMSYFPDTEKTVLFGGEGQYWSLLGDTWTFDGSTWTDISPTPSPSARSAASMVYDAANHQLVLFGGRISGGYSNETWTFDGTAWTDVSTTARPPARQIPSMAYDPTIGKVVMFGGDLGGQYVNDTWTFDGSTDTWTEVSPATSPSVRGGAAMFYDPNRGGVVMYGGVGSTGYSLAETWSYDGSANTWTQVSTSGSPGPLAGAAMTYDPDTGTLVLFGGWDQSAGVNRSDTWTFDGTTSTWTQLSLSTHPSGRANAGMTYDESAGELVLFGGGAWLADTWAFGVPVATVPGTPAAPLAVPGNGQVALSWTAPADGGSAITSYTVSYTPSGGTEQTQTVDPPALSTTITGLTNGTSYDFKVLATNGAGDGPYSAATTATPATVPSAPAAPNAVAGDSQVELSWAAPADGGSAITSYTVSYTPSGGTEQTQTVDPPALSTTITGLTNGTSYDFKVLATNGAGDGPYSTATPATPSGATVPAAPAAPDVVPGNGEVLVSWVAPDDGGSTITGYTLAWRPVDAPKKVKWTTRTTTYTSENVTGLVNNVAYAFKVLATNAVGSSAYSDEAPATPFAAYAPDTPTDVTPVPQVVGRSMDVTLTWVDGGYASTDHEVVVYGYRMSTKGVPTYREVARILTGSVDSSYVVQGLSAGKAYAFTVAAGNSDGWSLPSAYSAAVGG